MIIGNFIGIVMAGASFGVAMGTGDVLGFSEEGLIMMIAGPLLAVTDIVYRSRSRAGVMSDGGAGGTLCFLPAWLIGLLWFGFGVAYTLGIM